MSRQDDIKNLILINSRRLQKLKEQKAAYGLSVDPKILIEIEDIETEIEKLQNQLTNFENRVPPKNLNEVYVKPNHSNRYDANRRTKFTFIISLFLAILIFSAVYRFYFSVNYEAPPTTIALVSTNPTSSSKSLPMPSSTDVPVLSPSNTATRASTSTPLSASTTPTFNLDYQATVSAVVYLYHKEIKVENFSYLDSSRLSQVLMEPVLEKQKRSACWLQNEGLYYQYRDFNFVIDSITFDEDYRHATLLAQIHENRVLRDQNGVYKDFGSDTYRTVYELERVGDEDWYIYCYQALQDDDPIGCEVKLEGDNPCN